MFTNHLFLHIHNLETILVYTSAHFLPTDSVNVTNVTFKRLQICVAIFFSISDTSVNNQAPLKGHIPSETVPNHVPNGINVPTWLKTQFRRGISARLYPHILTTADIHRVFPRLVIVITFYLMRRTKINEDILSAVKTSGYVRRLNITMYPSYLV